MQKRTRKSVEPVFKRPEGMHRELYALLYSDQRLVIQSFILNMDSDNILRLTVG